MKEAVVGGPLVEGTVERSTNEKAVVEGSLVEDTVNKNFESINFYLNDGKIHIQVVHCFSISEVYQIAELRVLILMH